MHLQDLIDRVRAAWQWDTDRYPKVDLTDPTAARQHVLLHVLKAVGTMAACQERYDHGSPFGGEEHREAAVKLLIDALQMLALENMGSKEIVRRVEDILRGSNA